MQLFFKSVSSLSQQILATIYWELLNEILS